MEEYTLLWQIMELGQGNLKLFLLSPFLASILHFFLVTKSTAVYSEPALMEAAINGVFN